MAFLKNVVSKVRKGLSTVQEVLRVTASEDEQPDAPELGQKTDAAGDDAPGATDRPEGRAAA